MRIYQYRLAGENGDRLGRSFPSVRSRSDDEGNFLLIVHPKDSGEIREAIEQFQPADSSSHCEGILFVKGVPFGGLNDRSEALAIEREHEQSVHLVSYAIETKSDTDSRRRQWAEFFRRVEQENQVDWDLIDSDWPENLVALYMLACAVKNGDSPLQEKLQKRFEWEGEAQDEWESIIKQASREYKVHSGQEKELDPRTNDSKNVIASCLRETSPHVSK